MRLAPLAFVSGAAASYGSVVASDPGGALPIGVHAPSTSGFKDPVVLPSRGGGSVCVSGTVPVTASTTKNYKIDFVLPENQTTATNAWVEYVTQGSDLSTAVLGDTTSVSGTYDIAATLCVPANDTKPKGVQFMTHGVGFDQTYWDFAPGYSYVDAATDAGYAAFIYDRLGVGASDTPDGLSVVQAPLELEIAHELAKLLRAGHFSNATFSTVVGGGHSYGSIITQGLTAAYPAVLDAAVLTGFSANETGQPTFILALNLAIAAQTQPLRFSALSPAYLAVSSSQGVQSGFFRAPAFDPAVLATAYATQGTVTYGELFTTAAITATAKTFANPVVVVDGANDFPFCFGNCSYPTDLAADVRKALFPKVTAAKFDTYLAPGTGHGVNLHYSAVGAFDFIQKFLVKQGLGM